MEFRCGSVPLDATSIRQGYFFGTEKIMLATVLVKQP